MYNTFLIMNLISRKQALVAGACIAFLIGGQVAPVFAADIVNAAAATPSVRSVTGTVVDQNGDPIIGANVVVKGTQNGTITDFDGNFKLDAPQGAVLEVSYIGYITKEVKADNSSGRLKIQLDEDTKIIDEVVVVGYGTQRKEAVTGSVASVKGDILREVPGADITQAMQGRVAGVQMMQSSSKPGASMQIRIRGTRSLNASNDPLIVLDGIPFAGSINDIDPNNIKSMDILKDASATAIYGSRGANGVILITTNNGSKGMAPVVKYNMYVGAKTNFAKYPMMNGEKFAKMRSLGSKHYKNSLDEDDSVNTDWQDMFFKTGFTTNQDVSVTGGSSANSYSVGASYFRDEATIPTQNFNRYAMHAGLDQEIGKYVKAGFSTNTNYSITNNANLGIYNVLSASPLINPYNEDGTLKEVVAMPEDKIWTYTRDRVENLGDKYKDQTNAFGTYNTFYGEVKAPFLEGLKYRINLGLNYRHNKYGSYTAQGVFSDSPSTASKGDNNNTTTWSWTVEHLLSFDKTFGKHTFNAVALYSAEKYHSDAQSINGTNFRLDEHLWYNMGNARNITVSPDNQPYSESGLVSYMGRIMYNYDEKYMASVAVRRDGSSRLAPSKRWHTYPAVSLGWNMAKESFLEDVDIIENLKLRVGYGETANQAIDPYKTLGNLARSPYNFGATGYDTGFYFNELPNVDLGWEYSKTWNFGVDFSLLNGRLSGTAEYYIQNTENILLPEAYPGSAGISSRMSNIGKSRNKGFELSLNGIIFENKDGWSWEAGVNFYCNRNELTELSKTVDANGNYVSVDRDEANGWFVGHPINVVYDYEKIGIWQKGEEELLNIQESGGKVGMIKVKGGYDESGNPREINASDRQIIELDPAWEGGFNTRVSYKNWDLSVVASFRHGGKLISTLYGSSGYLNMLTGRRGNIDVNYWTEDNPTNDYPSPAGPVNGDNPKYGSTLAFFSGSYLKFRTITLGYNFKGEWMKKAGLKNLRAYATVTNPFVMFSPYHSESGMDPETNSRGNENQASPAYGSKVLVVGYNTPTTRNYLFGLNVTF